MRAVGEIEETESANLILGLAPGVSLEESQIERKIEENQSRDAECNQPYFRTHLK